MEAPTVFRKCRTRSSRLKRLFQLLSQSFYSHDKYSPPPTSKWGMPIEAFSVLSFSKSSSFGIWTLRVGYLTKIPRQTRRTLTKFGQSRPNCSFEHLPIGVEWSKTWALLWRDCWRVWTAWRIHFQTCNGQKSKFHQRAQKPGDARWSNETTNDFTFLLSDFASSYKACPQTVW